jgi:O-antigen ligase
VRAIAQPATARFPFAAEAGPYRFTPIVAALTCALMPWYTVRWHYGPLPTTLLETAILVTLLVFVIESWRGRIFPEWRSPLTIPAAVFLLAGAISVIVSPDHRAALGLYRAYFIEPMAFFIAVSYSVRSWDTARLILLGLAISAVSVCVPEAYLVLRALRHHTLNLAGATPVVVYQTANALALFVNPLIAVAMAIAAYSRLRLDRWASALFLLIALCGSLLTFSRGGYVSLLAMFVLLSLTHRSRIWLVPGLAIIAIAFSRIPAVASRIAHQFNPTDPNNSLEERVRLWKATLHLLHDHPIFGTGLASFARSINPYRSVSNYTDTLIYPHDVVLNFWVETGLLGLAAFTWLFVQAVRTAWTGWRAGPANWKPYQLGVLLMLAGIVVHGLVDVPYFKNDLSLEFWVLLGLSWAGRRWVPAAA